ncbi:MAG: putative transcriptional regulator [Bacteroidetes bacterium]|nr:putative transcriptional regulator [Bacteroidota bacterium]
MNYRDLQDLVEEGEGFQLEFKRKVSSPEKTARTLIGFANTKGGTILFGVDDDHSVVGVESEKSEVEMIKAAGSVLCEPPIDPDIEIVSYKSKDVIVVRVAESGEKPHAFIGEIGLKDYEERVFIRVNDKTVVASKEVVRILRSETPDAPPLRITIGEPERRLFDYLEDHERITVREFGKLVNVSNRRASRTLTQLVRAGVLRIHTHEKEDYFTKAFD